MNEKTPLEYTIDDILGSTPEPPPVDPQDPGFDPDASNWTGAPEPDTRPQIVCEKNNEHDCVRKAVGLLATDELVYQRSGTLVTVVRQSPFDLPLIAQISSPRVRTMLAEKAWWGAPRKRGKQHVIEGVSIPAAIVSQVHEAGYWPEVRPLEGLSTSPIVHPDGSVRWEAGYDPETGTYYTPVSEVPEQTLFSQASAVRCRKQLLDVVADFPWSTDTDADVWLSGLLAPLVRSWSGPAPIVALTSASAGTGKGLLADLVGIVILGRAPARMAWTDDQEELEKRVIASVMAGATMVVIDNLPSGSDLRGSVLDMAATADRVSGRVLRESTMIDLPHRACWYATGNNIGTKGDTARRTLVCRIVSTFERPEERDDIREPELAQWVTRRRGDLLCWAITIVASYLRAGCPAPPRALGSFSGWSRAVRGAVIWAGGADVAQNLGSRLGDVDAEAALQRRVLKIMLDAGGQTGCTAQRLVKFATPPDEDHDVAAMLDEIAPPRGTRYEAKRIVRALTAMKERPRVIGGKLLRLEQNGVDGFGWPLWRVVDVGANGSKK